MLTPGLCWMPADKRQPGPSPRTLVITDYVACVRAQKSASYSEIPFSEVRKGILWLSAVVQEKIALFCRP